jgi:hypothetical protein
MHSRRDVIKGAVIGTAGVIAATAGGAIFSITRAAGVDQAGSSDAAAAGAVRSILPTVSGPITGGKQGWPFGAYFGDIGKRNYVEEEFFISGTACSYNGVGDQGIDGHWTLEAGGTAPYKTRILVRRPRDAKKFNGTVVVEWANVSEGYEISFADPPGLYDGFAYVSVSAQKNGIDGYASKPKGLSAWDPDRYGSLSHPGDAYSFDIYTQAARSVGPHRGTGGVDPMGGLKVRKLVAIGGSQSGLRLMAYINGVQPRDNVFDALMPLVCAGTAAPFDNGQGHPDPATVKPGESTHSRARQTKVRDDLSVHVFALNSQTEALYYYPMRQPDSAKFVYWEVTGASHGGTGQIALIRQKTERDKVGGPGGSTVHFSDVMWLPSVDAAILHVHRWINGGKPPPSQPKMEISGEPPAYVLDKYGNVLGGVRLPEVEVPVARYVAPTKEGGILGSTYPFTAEEIKQLYPTHADYVSKVTVAANAALQAGVILPYRVKEYVDAAKAAAIPA